MQGPYECSTSSPGAVSRVTPSIPSASRWRHQQLQISGERRSCGGHPRSPRWKSTPICEARQGPWDREDRACGQDEFAVFWIPEADRRELALLSNQIVTCVAMLGKKF